MNRVEREQEVSCICNYVFVLCAVLPSTYTWSQSLPLLEDSSSQVEAL
jgi:hypothetical protein